MLQTRGQLRHPAGVAGRSTCWPHCPTATCFWSASCRRCWCSGFAAPCPSPRNGTRPGTRRKAVRAGHRRTCSAASVRRTTLLTIVVCALSLTGLLGLHVLVPAAPPQPARASPAVDRQRRRTSLVSMAILPRRSPSRSSATSSAAWLARWLRLPPGDRADVPGLLPGHVRQPTACRADHVSLLWWTSWRGLLLRACSACSRCTCRRCFPTLLRTTGAGFCYNIGRIAAAVGTVFSACSPGGRLPPGPALRRLPVPARHGRRVAHARVQDEPGNGVAAGRQFRTPGSCGRDPPAIPRRLAREIGPPHCARSCR